MVLHLISICCEFQNLLTFAEPKGNVIFVFCSRSIPSVSRSMHAGATSAAAKPDTPGVSFPRISKLSWLRFLFKLNKH